MDSTGFLDDTFNEGIYWKYDTRWPGWDRSMRGLTSVYGKLLAFDEDRIYGVNLLTEKVRVRRGFTPGDKGCRIFASEYNPEMIKDESGKGDVPVNIWSVNIPVRVRAMVLAGDKLLVAGPADIVPENNPAASFQKDIPSVLNTISTSDGEVISSMKLDHKVVFDGLIAVDSKLFAVCETGEVICLE